MRALVVQHDIVWERKSVNHANVVVALEATDPPPGTLVVLAELFDTGFSMNLPAIVDDQTLRWASGVAASRRIRLVVGHAEYGDDGRGRNCATVVGRDGHTVGTYRKVHPFSHGRESDHYSGGDRLLIAELAGVRVAPMICYDLRFPELWRLAARAGAEIFAIGASWPAARQAHWRALCIARAIENQAFVIAVNRVGRDPTIEYAGGSIIVDPHGHVLHEADAGPCVLSAELDIDGLRAWRSRFPVLSDIHADLLGTIGIQRLVETE